VTEPKREQVLDIVDEPTPLIDEIVAPAPSVEAPYGYKKDGTPAKKRGRPSLGGSSSSKSSYTPRRSTTSLKNQIGGFIMTVNIPVQMFSNKNALDAVEIEALAKALDEECQRNQRFRKYVEQMLAVQGGTSLVLVVAAIAGRRVARNNLIDIPEPIGNEGLDNILGGFISMTAGAGPINPNLRSMSQQETNAQ
jgi:hypothetical protein